MGRTIIAGLAGLVLFGACQKKESIVPDGANVRMTITAPLAGQTFKSGDTVFMKAIVKYPGEMHGYEVKVVDTATGNIVYDAIKHIHADSFTVDDQWVSLAHQRAGMKLSIIAIIDHDGEAARQEVAFEIVP